MKTYKKILIANTALACAVGIYLGTGAYRDHQHEAKYNARVSELVAGFKEKCPPDTSRDQRCFYEQPGLENAAKLSIASGDFARAGLILANLQGREKEAIVMAEKCEKKGDMEGAKKIREELSARAKAIATYYGEQKPKKDEPAPAGSH